MKKAADLLRTILDQSRIDEAKTYSSFFRSWARIAGPDLAAHSKVIDIRNGVVVVEADHPGWLQMIQIRRASILRKVRKSYPELEIRDLRFFLEREPAREEANPKKIGDGNSVENRSVSHKETNEDEGYREFERFLQRVRRGEAD